MKTLMDKNLATRSRLIPNLHSTDETRGRSMRDALQCIFCVCEANLLLTPRFFHFGINTGVEFLKIQFEKDIIEEMS